MLVYDKLPRFILHSMVRVRSHYYTNRRPFELTVLSPRDWTAAS